MPHIHTKPGEHDNTASAFIVRTDGDEPRLMLHLHKKLHRFLQFGGHIEINETPWQAVTHEILEESGYEMDQLRLLQPKIRIKALTGAVIHPVPIYHNTHPFNESHFHTDSGYGFVTHEAPRHPIAANESDHFRLVTRDELAALPADEIFESVREPGLFLLDVYLDTWEAVGTSLYR